MVKQVLHDGHPIVTGCKVKGGGVATLEVPAVYVLRGAKLLPNGKDTLGI